MKKTAGRNPGRVSRPNSRSFEEELDVEEECPEQVQGDVQGVKDDCATAMKAPPIMRAPAMPYMRTRC